jgi:hypothetical protein
MNRWALIVDIDELFDYPHSDELSLPDVLRYLNEREYTVLVAQLLDMFADGPLELVMSGEDDDLRLAYPFFDISSIWKTDYEFQPHRIPMSRCTGAGSDTGCSARRTA